MIVYDTTYTLWRYNMSGSVNKVTLVGNLGRDQLEQCRMETKLFN